MAAELGPRRRARAPVRRIPQTTTAAAPQKSLCKRALAPTVLPALHGPLRPAPLKIRRHPHRPALLLLIHLDHLLDLPVPSLASDPSFVFLWVGSGAGEGLERGREVLAKWGYRRAEDVVWVKTNKTTNRGPGWTDPPTTSVLTRTKQHCLMGIRGTVRRSTDSWFVHCNVDTDVIIWEGDPSDPTRKPPEMYTLIENFCLGLRRLEIFGRLSSLRRGWVTVLAPGQEGYIPGDGAVGVDFPEEGDEGVNGVSGIGSGNGKGVGGGGDEGDGTEGMGFGGYASASGSGSGSDARMRTAHRWVQQTWEEGIREIGQTALALSATSNSISNTNGSNINGATAAIITNGSASQAGGMGLSMNQQDGGVNMNMNMNMNSNMNPSNTPLQQNLTLSLGPPARPVVPTTHEIDALRPKSPVRAGHGGGHGGG
ncbi:MT-A70-domain-containing protein, partial [Gymnopilus junonius]